VRDALRRHWPEYLIEAAGLGLFMVSACVFGTFWRLGKVAPADAGFYVLAQAVGGLGGILVAASVLGDLVAHPSVRYVATVPGPAGGLVAFAAECAITFLLMTTVLRASNIASLARFTGLFAGALVAVYITVEAPISGMSMNPARSLASAVWAAAWGPLWIYLVAPPLGMLVAAEAYVRRHGPARVFCAKLHHDNAQPCIFHCRYADMRAAACPTPPASAPAAVRSRG
jgi:aquaporin Z